MQQSKQGVFSDMQNARFNPDFVQTGIVMDNRDPHRSGRLKVWIDGSQSPKESKGGWIICRYGSPFGGRTPGIPNANNYSTYPKSYGFWAVPPDTGTEVMLYFANGNIHDAVWFGVVPNSAMNSMTPGMGTEVIPQSEISTPVPITDYDRNTITTTTKELYYNIPLMNGLKKQNLLYDEEYGVACRNARRQIPATVYGMSTPRGNTIVLDDGYTDEELNAKDWDSDPDGYQDTQAKNPANDTSVGNRKLEGICLRTRSGAQILLSEHTGRVFVINRDGTARFEMDVDGNINFHSYKSFTLRAEEDINMSAGRDINFEAGRNYNLKVGGKSTIYSIGEIDTKTDSNYTLNVGGTTRVVTAAETKIQSAGTIHVVGQNSMKVSITGSFNLSATENTIINSSSVSVKGSTNIKLSGGASNVTLDSNVSSSTNIFAPNLITPKLSVNDHTHKITPWTSPSNHGEGTTPGEGGASSGSPQAAQTAESADKADDKPAEVPVETEQQSVVSINTSPDMQQRMEADTITTVESDVNIQSLETLGYVMPCSGTISQYGFWGKDVARGDGLTENRPEWIIKGDSNVVAVADAKATVNEANKSIILAHGNGYMTVYRALDTLSIKNGDIVKKGDTIATNKGIMLFGIRKANTSLYGFSGSVDPGLFYYKITGIGSDCANKALTVGKMSSPDKTPSDIKVSPDSTEYVQITKVKSIGSGYGKRGSTNSPTTKKRTKQSNDYTPEPIDVGNIDKTAIDWKVTPQDQRLIKDIIRHEGPIPYQKKLGYFRNDRFWTYLDSLRKPTIGYGHLLQNESFPNGLTEAEAEALLAKDMVRTVNGAMSIANTYKMRIPYEAQLILTEMVFQLGKGGVLKFKGFLKALTAGDYRRAAAEMKDSAWYRQTPRRVDEMAARISALA